MSPWGCLRMEAMALSVITDKLIMSISFTVTDDEGYRPTAVDVFMTYFKTLTG